MTRSRRPLGLGQVLCVRRSHDGAGFGHLGRGEGAMLGLPLRHYCQADTSPQLAFEGAADEAGHGHARLDGGFIDKLDEVGRQCYRYLLGRHALTIPRYGPRARDVWRDSFASNRADAGGAQWVSLLGILIWLNLTSRARS